MSIEDFIIAVFCIIDDSLTKILKAAIMGGEISFGNFALKSELLLFYRQNFADIKKSFAKALTTVTLAKENLYERLYKL